MFSHKDILRFANRNAVYDHITGIRHEWKGVRAYDCRRKKQLPVNCNLQGAM